MRVLAAIHPPGAAAAILDCLGLASRAPPPLPARSDDAEAGPASAGWAADDSGAF
jgi:hypothetical protein